MPCCLICLIGFFLPRVTLFFLWLLSGYLGRAYETVLWPLLGFFFLPYMTLAYAVAVNEFGGLKGMGLLVFVVGVLLDFGVMGGGARAHRRRYE